MTYSKDMRAKHKSTWALSVRIPVLSAVMADGAHVVPTPVPETTGRLDGNLDAATASSSVPASASLPLSPNDSVVKAEVDSEGANPTGASPKQPQRKRNKPSLSCQTCTVCKTGSSGACMLT